MRAEPIRDLEKIAAIKSYLKAQKKYRNYALFVLGINSALRISDILKLKWNQVVKENNIFRESIVIKEKKTGKTKKFPINESMREALYLYRSKSKPKPEVDDYIFKSRQKDKSGNQKAITRQMTMYMMKDLAKLFGIEDNISTHTFRKTFAYQAWKSGVPIETLMQILNHSNPSETKIYIGITQDEIDEVYVNLNLQEGEEEEDGARDPSFFYWKQNQKNIRLII